MQLMSELKVSLLWVSVLTRSGAMARVSFRASGAEGRLLRGYAPPEADGPLTATAGMGRFPSGRVPTPSLPQEVSRRT